MKFLFTWQRFGRIGRRSRQTLQSLPIILALLSPRPALSAEAINITLRSIAFDIPLMDLETFAKTGQISPELGFIEATLTPAQIASLRSLLQESLDLDATIISQFLALPEGDILLARLGSLVAEEPGEQQTEAANPVNQQTGAAQLREALLAAAVAPEGLSLLNLVRQFPAERLSLDVEQVLALINENADFYARRPAILQALQAEANQHRLPLPPGPLEALDQPGKVAWRRQPMTFRNPERASFSVADLYLPEGGSTPASPSAARPQATAPASIPVVLLSHGLGSNRNSLAYLAQHLASHGYGVVSIEHYETSSDRITRFFKGMAAPPSASELLLRPRDITAVLDSLTSRAQTDPKLAQLDLNRVGIVGQSLGGYTALAAAGAELNRPLLAQRCPEDINRFTLNISLPLQCRLLDLPVQTSFQVKDPRIGAVLAINPLTSQIFGPSGLAKLEVPVMFVAGTHDYFAPALPEQLQPFGWLKTTHKYLLLADNSTHFSFLGDTGTSELLPTSKRLLGPDGRPAQQALQALGLAFFDRHLEGDRKYSLYLNQTYVDSLAQGPFQYSLVETLPESLLRLASPETPALTGQSRLP